MSPWLPWVYQYSVGGVLFVISVWVLCQVGALRPARRGDRWLLLAMIGGLLAFMAIHAIWIALATGGGGAS
jgi:hypothetical protein